MKVIASAAMSIDGYLDDNSDTRLILSSPQDLDAVQALRARCDAILVGANTVRKDNPSLTARTTPPAYPVKVTITKSGNIDPQSRFIQDGTGQKIIYCTSDIQSTIKDKFKQNLTAEAFEALTIKVFDGTATAIIADLSASNISTLMIEGGAQTLKDFLNAGLIDEFRLAIAPINLSHAAGDDETAARLTDDDKDLFMHSYGLQLKNTQTLGDTVIYNYEKNHNHEKWMKLAIQLSEDSPATDRYRVGALIIDPRGKLVSSGYTGELSPICHAEEAALEKPLKNGADLRGCTIYSSMEPCSTRASMPHSCTELIINSGITRTVFALSEPPIFVTCEGHALLEQAGIQVIHLAEYAQSVRDINSHLIK